MPNSPRYKLAKLIADALNALTRGIIQGAASIEFHLAEFNAKLESKTLRLAEAADAKAVQVAEDVHDKLIAVHHTTMKEASVMYEAAQREAYLIIQRAKLDRERMVNAAADGCDEVRQALRKARNWHDA
jgi:cell division septum initiation protein DivIVA